jgi:hypothetical protein
MLQEKEEVAVKRKRCKEILRVLQQAAWVCRTLQHPFSSLSSSFFSFFFLASVGHLANMATKPLEALIESYTQTMFLEPIRGLLI